jgi:hypothetical protein
MGKCSCRWRARRARPARSALRALGDRGQHSCPQQGAGDSDEAEDSTAAHRLLDSATR